MEYIINISNNYQNIYLQNKEENINLTLEDVKNFNKVKFFHNDIVEYNKNTKEIKVKKSNIKYQKIVGIIEINNKMIYGFNSKKNPYFLFKPLNKYYPNFYVSINDKTLKNQNGRYYILIKYNEWTKKLPYGTLEKFIGHIGEKNNEIEKLLYYYNIDRRNLKIDIKQTDNIYDIFTDNDLKNIINKTNLDIISIDPKNSKDIDDALSIQYVENFKIIGIHIADVSTWFFKKKLDQFIHNNKYFTVYLKNIKYNLFPNILSDNLMSLLQNKDRLSLSLYIRLDKDNKIINYYYENNIINVKKNYTYEKFNNIIKSNDKKYKHYIDLFEISKNLNLSFNDNDYDSHNMIENYMILANKITGEYLVKNNKNPILRYHEETKYNIKYDNIQNYDLIHFLKIFQTKSAKYKEYNNTETFNYYHFGLNIDLYAHFTSPIRRFVDIINHIKIKECLFENCDKYNKEINVEDINITNKNLRKMDREISEIEKIEELNDKIVNGYLINYKENYLYFYVPEYKYYFRKKIYNNENMYKDLDFKINDDNLIITNKINNSKITLFKYYSYDISIKKLLNSNEIYYNLITIDFQKIIL